VTTWRDVRDTIGINSIIDAGSRYGDLKLFGADLGIYLITTTAMHSFNTSS
jgi:hypothetical protein